MDIFYGSRKIASHRRLYGENKWQLDPYHYLNLILRRPQAFESARPIKQWRKTWPGCLERLFRHFCQRQGQSKGTKDFIKVLILFKGHDEGEVNSVVEEALSANLSSSEAVRQLLINRAASQDDSFTPLHNWETIPPPDVSVYDQVGGAV